VIEDVAADAGQCLGRALGGVRSSSAVRGAAWASITVATASNSAALSNRPDSVPPGAVRWRRSRSSMTGTGGRSSGSEPSWSRVSTSSVPHFSSCAGCRHRSTASAPWRGTCSRARRTLPGVADPRPRRRRADRAAGTPPRAVLAEGGSRSLTHRAVDERAGLRRGRRRTSRAPGRRCWSRPWAHRHPRRTDEPSTTDDRATSSPWSPPGGPSCAPTSPGRAMCCVATRARCWWPSARPSPTATPVRRPAGRAGVHHVDRWTAGSESRGAGKDVRRVPGRDAGPSVNWRSTSTSEP